MRSRKALFKTNSWYLGACLSLWFGFVASGFAQGADAPLSPQERLDAIRQSLVEASLETPTKVTTTSWIDATGSLRESSSFKNGMEVRGVRVLAYGRDDVGQPKARLQGSASDGQSVTQTQAQAAAQGQPVCANKAVGSMNHLVSLDLAIDPNAHPIVMNAFVSQLQSNWVDALSLNGSSGQASPWRAVNNLASASMSKKMTTYERALVSNRPVSMPWHANLKVRTEVLPQQGIENPFMYKHPRLALHIDFELRGNDAQTTKFQEQYSLIVDLVRHEWAQAQLSSESRERIQTQLQTWRTNAEQWLSCQPQNPAVTAVNGQQIEINAGSMAGVKQGDEWLIANPAHFPKELASKNGAPQTLLAKVQSVTPFNSQLIVLAGPVQAVQANWRAWPTETILKEPSLQTASAASSIRDAKPVTRPLKPMANSSNGLFSAAN